MSTLRYITGRAGTGKTHQLGEELIRWVEDNTLLKHQSILVLTRMHGSRKRLLERLGDKVTVVRLVISTVDSFALSIVNRWRLSFGFDAPILPKENGDIAKDDLGYQISFDDITSMAAKLLQSSIVAKTISNSYPLVIVDEFQDCVGDQLEIISGLKGFADLVIAADPFQALDGVEAACDWAKSYSTEKTTSIISLEESRRTSSNCLLEAAQALVKNIPAQYSSETLPFFFAPTYAVAIWKVLPRIPTGQNAALIYPTRAALRNLQKTKETQSLKRVSEGKKPIIFPWLTQFTDNQLFDKTITEFKQAIVTNTWRQNGKWKKLYTHAMQLARARGYKEPPSHYLNHVVSGFIQSRKFVSGKQLRFEATTVHGAKNREFDHVFIIWDGNLCGNFSVDCQRRMLYNAITRARLTCTVVGLGTLKKLQDCPVLSLLGTPCQPFKE